MNNHRMILFATMIFLFMIPFNDVSAKPSYRIGASCNPEKFQTICDKDNVIYCSPKDKVVMSDNCNDRYDGDTPRTCVEFSHSSFSMDCDEDSETCKPLFSNSKKIVVINTKKKSSQKSSQKTAIACVPLADKCNAENETITRCDKSSSGRTRNKTYTCEKTKDGRLFYHLSNFELCHGGMGVCSDDGQCLDPAPCEPGFKDHCEGNILKQCKNNHLLSKDCASGHKPQICSVVNGKPACIKAESECTKEGDIKVTGCNAKTGLEIYEVCTRADNGKLYYHRPGIHSEKRRCLNGCSDDKKSCKPVACTEIGTKQTKCRIQGLSTAYTDIYTCTEVNGKKQFVYSASEKCDNGYGTCSNDGQCVPAESCTASDFTPKCENNVAVNCIRNKIRYENCNQNNIMTCAVTEIKAGCYPNKKSCQTEGEEIVTRCNPKTNHEQLSTCTRISDDLMQYVASGKRACDNGCNEDNTACAE